MEQQKVHYPDSLRDITIIRRNHKRSPFHPQKIAIAIKKGFDSLEESHYDQEDSYRVYTHVMEQLAILSETQDTLAIEEIQDTIEKQLLKLGYEDVYESFASYRLRRSESRKVFMSSQHKFLKALENLSFSEEDHEHAMAMLADFGETITYQFARSYLVSEDFISLHDDGYIYIHNLASVPLSTTGAFLLDIERLVKPETPFNALITQCLLAIEMVKLDHHGEQGIDDFDSALAPGVVETFKHEFINTLQDYQLISGHTITKWEALKKQASKLQTIDIDLSAFDKYFSDRHSDILLNAYTQSLNKTEEIVKEALTGFINTLSVKAMIELSLSIGLATSKEGRMVARQLVLCLIEKSPLNVSLVFKVKEGINVAFEDENYDLFTLAQSIEGLCLANMDFKGLEKGAYFGSGLRVGHDLYQNEPIVFKGRGVLSMTSLNLIRLGIQYGYLQEGQVNTTGFFEHLEQLVKSVLAQLVERYELQTKKKASYFPYLIEGEQYMESDKLKAKDSLKKVLRHGVMGINLVGVHGCVRAMNHEISDDEIVAFVSELVEGAIDKYGLNFGCLQLNFEKVNLRFKELDTSIFGRLEFLEELDELHQIDNHLLLKMGHLKVLDKDYIETYREYGFVKLKGSDS